MMKPDPFAKKIESLRKSAQKRKVMPNPPVEVYGPCCCGDVGSVSDGHRNVTSKKIPCSVPCIPAVCEYDRSAERHLGDPGTVSIPAAALRSLRGKTFVEIDGMPFNGSLLADTARGLPGKTVRARAFRGDGDDTRGFVALGGPDWRALQVGRGAGVADAEKIDFRTLAAPPKKEKITGAAKLERKMAKATWINKKAGRDGPGFGSSCSCNGFNVRTIRGNSLFAVRAGSLNEPTTGEEACLDICGFTRTVQRVLKDVGQPANFRKLRNFLGRRREPVSVDGAVLDSQLAFQTLEDLDADRVRVYATDRFLDIGAEDGSWVARIMVQKEKPVRSATIQDLLGYRR